MLVAEDEKNIRYHAWETDKRQGPFHCPECGSEVILKKGIIRAHHLPTGHLSLANMEQGSQNYITRQNVRSTNTSYAIIFVISVKLNKNYREFDPI